MSDILMKGTEPIGQVGDIGRVIKSISANTYTTYALALAELWTAFNALFVEEKRKAIIVRGDNLIYHIDTLSVGRFSTATVGASSYDVQSVILSTNKFYTFTSPNTYSDYSSSAQSNKLDLIVL